LWGLIFREIVFDGKSIRKGKDRIKKKKQGGAGTDRNTTAKKYRIFSLKIRSFLYFLTDWFKKE
jgi:hypothetical protein